MFHKNGLSRTLQLGLYALLALLFVVIVIFCIAVFYGVTFLVQTMTSLVDTQTLALPGSTNIIIETTKKYGEYGMLFIRQVEGAIQSLLDMVKSLSQFF